MPKGKQITHGYARRGKKSAEYKVWTTMKGRCKYPNGISYKYYGARGIQVCEEWKNSFLSFLGHVGERPSSQHMIDRIDNERGYEPGNVRWSLPKVQYRNRRSTRVLTINGATKSIVAWSEQANKNVKIICARLAYGWSPERAVFARVRDCGRKR